MPDKFADGIKIALMLIKRQINQDIKKFDEPDIKLNAFLGHVSVFDPGMTDRAIDKNDYQTGNKKKHPVSKKLRGVNTEGN